MDGIRIPENALVLVGDGAKALFLRNHGSESEPLLEVEQVMENPNPPTRDQGRDRPGRRGASAAAGAGNLRRGGIEQTDWHTLEEARFAADIAEGLYQAAHAGTYDKLVVVAPPGTLGELRKQFHPEVREKIVEEIPKDLTHHGVAQIEGLLSGTRH